LNSPILTQAQMRAAEAAAFTRGISAEALMEQAGKRIAQSVASFFLRLASASSLPVKVITLAMPSLPRDGSRERAGKSSRA
jgi:NAD(P)H-hydrate repair Nnr-like enzyme with NAD(P)H-hydrate epimerase domain